MNHLQVKNFDKFQHYKDRTPPWIKLYNDILDDYEFSCLRDASKLHLILIWLLASRTNNKFPADPKWIQQKIMALEPVDIDELIDSGFLEIIEVNQPLQTTVQVDSEVVAECQQSACLEGETETEKETEGETEKEDDLPDGLNVAAWCEYIKYRKEAKLRKLKPTSVKQQQRWMVEQGPADVQQQIVNNAVRNGWAGLHELKGGSNGTSGQGCTARVAAHIQRRGSEAVQAEQNS